MLDEEGTASRVPGLKPVFMYNLDTRVVGPRFIFRRKAAEEEKGNQSKNLHLANQGGDDENSEFFFLQVKRTESGVRRATRTPSCILSKQKSHTYV